MHTGATIYREKTLFWQGKPINSCINFSIKLNFVLPEIMKFKLKFSSLVLAIIVFLSSTGHAFSIHFCTMEQMGELEATCMQESNCCCITIEQAEDISFESSNECCFNSINYIINPFSVRQPESQLTKINIVAKEVSLIYLPLNTAFVSIEINQLFYDNTAPPGKSDLLSMISTFQI